MKLTCFYIFSGILPNAANEQKVLKQAIRKYLILALHLDFTAVLCLTRACLWMDVTLKNKALMFFVFFLVFYFCFVLTPELTPSSQKCKIAGLSSIPKEITYSIKCGSKVFFLFIKMQSKKSVGICKLSLSLLKHKINITVTNYLYATL